MPGKDNMERSYKMSIKDRGNIKWTSLMLVEHRKKLEKLKNNENNKEKPELSEDELERLNYILKRAINENLNIEVIYYHKKNFHHCKGKIMKIKSFPQKIILNSNEKYNKIKILINDIIDIKLIDY